ncbi:hypothetical protein JTB14_020361 [Gonioctena quinquepunctata]|nr:hypothetical protein JTB14_020361 [Gonioctena quinquepunctata]
MHKVEESINFQSGLLDDIQKSLKTLTKENSALRKEQKELKNRIEVLEKLSSVDHIIEQEQTEHKSKNIIIMGLGGTNSEEDVHNVFKKINFDAENEYSTQVLNSQVSQKTYTN